MHLHRVHVGSKSLQEYASIQGPAIMNAIRKLAPGVRDMRMLHVSATAFGGGVAEIMYTLVPLMRDAGVETEWRVMHGRDEFFDVTKAIHNGLQGDARGLTEEQREIFLRYNRINAEALRDDVDDFDVVVIHDPQPVFVPLELSDARAKFVWRCHIDLSTPNPDVLGLIAPALPRYDAAIFHLPDFVPAGVDLRQPVTWPPAIDPLAPKNMALAREDAAFITRQFGVDPDRPLMVQVSRFDPWKDPLGVIDAYRLVRPQFPGLQLALIGSMAHDDPEGMEVYRRCLDHADEDPSIIILSNIDNVGAVEVNAFQCLADVVVQKSIREGFGLTVSEALWKARPTVGGNVGGIRLQIIHGETGWLVNSSEECAEACIEALSDPVRARRLALAGKERVRQNFLTPRLVLDWLRLLTAFRDGTTYAEVRAATDVGMLS
jgi:trehalose synthase